jgi:hypothetical protein
MPKRLCTDSLKRYSRQFTLIPLHAYDATRKKRGKVRRVGKAPRDFNWTKRDYSSKAVLQECVGSNINVGIRLTADQLVIDVDPRNGGNEGFAKLSASIGLDASLYPTVITGSGGEHLYMKKPPGLLIADTLPDFPGVEFKSKGRQVVAAGSIHPDTLAFYEWSPLSAEIEDGLPDAPQALLNVIARPARDVMIKGGGQWDQETAARALACLDPEDFRDEAEWRRIMMGIHHATNGDARHEFVEWSTSDPQYADDAEIIGRRWDSLHTERPDGDVITYGTVLKAIGDKGTSSFDWIDTEGRAADFEAFAELDDEEGEDTKAPWEEDFEGLDAAREADKARAKKSRLPGGNGDDGVKPENFGGFDDESLGLLNGLNKDYATIVDGGKFRVITQSYEPVLERKGWEKLSPSDFMIMYSNQRIQRSEDELKELSRGAAKTAPLGKAWIEWPKRKHYKGLIFDPKKDAAHAGYLNVWTGFALGSGSENGSWKWLNDLIFEVLAEGSDENHDYIINWLRFLFQYPERRAECAVVFKGGKGVGKGTLGNTVVKCIGHHALSVGAEALITGRFNSHFRDLLFLFSDEAIKPHDRAAESQLKNLITEPLVAYEGKGVDVKQGPNFLHVMMASNEAWVVPASPDERRYFVTECTTRYQRNTAFFDKLYAQLSKENESGYRRFLWDMLTTPLPKGFHPRNYPMTDALVDQKVRSQSVLSQFFFDAINDGATPFRVCAGNWEKEPVRIFLADFRDAFTMWQRERGISTGGMGRGNMRFVFQELQQLFPMARVSLRQPVTEEFVGIVQAAGDGRAKAIEIPSVADCKACFRERLGGDCFAPTPVKHDFG